MKKFKKIIAMGLAVMAAISAMSIPALAEDGIMPLAVDKYEGESFTPPYNTNNYFTEAQTIEDDDNLYGKLSSTSDRDYYKVTFQNNGTANFYVKAPVGCVYEIEVFAKHGSVYTSLGTGAYSGDRERLLDSLSVSAGVEYYIMISCNQWSPISNGMVYFK